MSAELVFESRATFQLLRHDGTTEIEPVITLDLELTSGPKIYTTTTAIINNASWRMAIHRRGPSGQAVSPLPGFITYTPEMKQSRCTIELHQSPERYAALLEMFRGGYVSEITVLVDGLADKADYSKRWDTVALPALPILSLRFEFPLPQGDG